MLSFASVLKGDVAGHEFHGNQWTNVGGDHHVIAGHANGSWVDAAGAAVHSDIADRLKSLGVPPAWKDVKLSTDPNRPLQATGIDAAGRTQYKYTAEYRAGQDAAKFERGRAFNQEIGTIRASMSKDLASGDQKTRDAAACLALIDATGFRIGSNKDTGATNKDGEAEKHFGISTLTKSMVSVNGDEVILSFMGKSGKINEKTITDPALASYLGTRLNQIRPDTPVFESSDSKVRAYMKSIAGPDYSPKDFRTWHGTSKALETVLSMPKPTTDKESSIGACRQQSGR